jgi:hypothetical protein
VPRLNKAQTQLTLSICVDNGLGGGLRTRIERCSEPLFITKTKPFELSFEFDQLRHPSENAVSLEDE